MLDLHVPMRWRLSLLVLLWGQIGTRERGWELENSIMPHKERIPMRNEGVKECKSV